ncbi:MAG TPA: OmpA family protein [Burkholderiaceae bacterium]|nr:OmpA family protein [Burkholderiaceae bacterium]
MSSSIDVLRRSWLAALCCVVLAGCATAPPPPTKEARIATLKKVGFTPAGDGWEISLGVKVLFDSDVDTLTNDGRAAVSDLSRTLREVGVERIRVDGHTDNVGSDKYNAGLSLRRAESVAQHLRVVGWRDDAIERRGFGADKPVADNATAAGRAQNRRVVIAVHVQ